MLLLWVTFADTVNADDSPIALIPSEEYTIGELARNIAKEFGITDVVFDTSKADGQMRKAMDNARLKKHLKNFEFTSLEKGLKLTIEDYKQNWEKYRH